MAVTSNTANIPLSQETLHVLLRYDPETGRLFWRERPLYLCKNDRYWRAWNSRCAGQRADVIKIGKGYLGVTIFNRRYYAHRLVWLMFNDELAGDVDHINGVRDDNRIENLRAVTRSENLRNAKTGERNRSGAIGVNWEEGRQKWLARIVSADGKQVNLGRFDNLDDAIAARKAAEAEHGYHPNHGRKPSLERN